MEELSADLKKNNNKKNSGTNKSQACHELKTYFGFSLNGKSQHDIVNLNEQVL